MRENKGKVLNEWTRERTLFSRDFNGNLIPKIVPLIGDFEHSIMVLPKTIGETNKLKYLLESGELDPKLLKDIFFRDCLIFPKITDVKFIKPTFVRMIYYTLLFESGYDIEVPGIKSKINSDRRFKGNTKTKVKIYKLIKEDGDRAKYDFLLHELGYTFLDIPKLTRGEADLLLHSSFEINGKRNGKSNASSGIKK